MQLKNQWIFTSISEMVETLNNAPDLNRRYSSDDKDGDDWCDTNSYDEAVKCMIEGKIYDGIDVGTDKYRTNGHKEKSKQHLSVVGHNVVVPLYLQGIPNNMITKKQVINNKIVNMFYSCQAPHYVTQDEILETTKKLFRSIIELEQQGYRVNLYVIEVNSDSDGKWGYALKLKTDRETLNIKKLCFPIVSASFLRRMGFRVKERLYKDWIGSGYGNGRFDYDLTDKFIKTHFKLRNYEIWNYEGKQND